MKSKINTKLLTLSLTLAFNSIAAAQFTEPTILDSNPAAPSDILVHDINNDNNQDILITHNTEFASREILIFTGNGNGEFSHPQTIAPSSHTPQTLAIGDLNDDGFDDIVSVSRQNVGDSIVWYPSNSGSFSASITIDKEFHRFSDCRIVDVDNDGDLDILAIGDIAFLLYTNDGSGTFTKSIIPPGVITENYDLDIADFNNDGFIDAVIGGVVPIIYINNTDNTFTYNPAISQSLNAAPSLTFLVHAIDFDSDGDQDLILGDTTLRNYWSFAQQNDGLFALQQILSTNTPQSFSMASADFDNDGHLDLLSNYPQQGQTIWFKGAGNGQFEAADVVFQGAVPFTNKVATGDFNNDGVPDAVWSHPLSVQLSTAAPTCPADLTGDGLLNFTDVSAFVAAFGKQSPTADFSSDGLINFLDVSAFVAAFLAGCP